MMFNGLTAILPGEAGLAGVPLTFPLHSSCLTPSHPLLRHEKKEDKGFSDPTEAGVTH